MPAAHAPGKEYLGRDNERELLAVDAQAQSLPDPPAVYRILGAVQAPARQRLHPENTRCTERGESDVRLGARSRDAAGIDQWRRVLRYPARRPVAYPHGLP